MLISFNECYAKKIADVLKLYFKLKNQPFMKSSQLKFYLSVILICLNTSCAINYRALQKEDLQTYNEVNISGSGTIEVIKQELNAEKIINGNSRIKRQFEKKGYRSFLLTISNPSKDTILLSKDNLFAIEDYQRVPLLSKAEVSDQIRFNRGLFWAISGYGLITPFAYAGSEIIYRNSKLLIAVPVLSYGIINNAIAYRSAKRIKHYLNDYYLIGKSIPPGKKLSGIVVVKNLTENINFEYRSAVNK